MKSRPYLLTKRDFGEGGSIDERFGFVGDAHSGTLECQWCGREIFTQTHNADQESDEHWEWHLGALDRIIADWTNEREADNEAYEWWKSQQIP